MTASWLLKRLSRHSTRGFEAYRFIVAGLATFAVEYALLILLKEGLGIQYLIANAIAFTVAVALNYLLSVAWVFHGARQGGNVAKIAFFTVSVIGLGLNQLLMWLLVGLGGLYYLVAKLITSTLVMLWNYAAKRKVLFHASGPDVARPFPSTSAAN